MATIVTMTDEVELDSFNSNGRLQNSSPAPSYRSAASSALRRRVSVFEAEEPEAGAGIAELPPVDGGWRAWSYLAGAFVIELLVWGPPFVAGSFLLHYRSVVFQDEDSSLLPLIGSVGSGLMYLLSAVAVPVFARWPTYRKASMWIGLALCIISLIGASFAQTPRSLYALGGTAIYFSCSTYVFEWFVAKRGVAQGLVYCGSYLGGVGFPLLTEHLLSRFGHKTTLRIFAGMFAAVIPLALPLIRSRLPPAQVVGTRKVSWKFLRSVPFWILITSNLIQGLGNFNPALYLPTFATDIGISSSSATLTLSLLNIATAPGLVGLGWISDRHLPSAILLSAVGSTIAVYALWGTATSLPTLIAFALVFGALAPSWSSTWPAMITASQDDASQTLPLYGLFFATRGLGNVLAAPVSTALLRTGAVGKSFRGTALAFGFDEGHYAPLILFTGATMAVSTFGATYPFFTSAAKGDQQRQRRGSMRRAEEL